VPRRRCGTRGNLWSICRTAFRDRRIGLTRPGCWTPVFFLDDAVALAAGHRPCCHCRRDVDGWTDPVPRPRGGVVRVLTPPTSRAALAHGFRPELHPSVVG
jgi:hypothetical protein